MADSSAIIGLFMKEDEWHAPATKALEEIRKAHKRMLTTWDVFDEVVTALRRWGGYDVAVQAGEAMKASTSLTVVVVGDDVRDNAWSTFRKNRFAKLSYTDCTSVAVMKKYGIAEAFTFDEDFKKLGCTVIPQAEE